MFGAVLHFVANVLFMGSDEANNEFPDERGSCPKSDCTFSFAGTYLPTSEGPAWGSSKCS